MSPLKPSALETIALINTYSLLHSFLSIHDFLFMSMSKVHLQFFLYSSCLVLAIKKLHLEFSLERQDAWTDSMASWLLSHSQKLTDCCLPRLQSIPGMPHKTILSNIAPYKEKSSPSQLSLNTFGMSSSKVLVWCQHVLHLRVNVYFISLCTAWRESGMTSLITSPCPLCLPTL